MSKITANGDCSHEIKRRLLLGRKVMNNLDSILKSRDITLPTKVRLVKAMVFQVVMNGCESWTIKKAEHQRIDAFELWCWRRLSESPLDCKEIQPVHPRGNQSWVFIGRTDVEAETPILWPPDAKSWLISKDPDSGKNWGQEEKGTTEDEMTGWHHCLNGHEFGWTLGVGDGQGGLACCSPWGCKLLDTTERLIWTEIVQLGLLLSYSYCKKGQNSSVQNAAAAAAKLLQSCPTLCDPIDSSPPGFAIPGILSRQEHWSGLPFPSPMHESEKWKWSRSVMSDSLRPHGL